MDDIQGKMAMQHSTSSYNMQSSRSFPPSPFLMMLFQYFGDGPLRMGY